MINGELIKSFIRRHLRLTIMVAVASGVLSCFLITLFPAMNPIDAESISKSWPQIMKDIFGDPAYGFTDIYAWMNLELFHITLWIICGVFSAIIASDVIAKEIDGRTIDIVLSTSVTRTGLISSRIVGIIVLMATVMLATLSGCVVGILTSEHALNIDMLIKANVLVLLISLVFAALTILISVFVPRQISSAFISVTIMGIMFLFLDLAKLVPVFNALRIFNPFYYYKPHEILIYDKFSCFDPWFLIGISTAIMAISVMLFSKRDITL